MNLSYQLSFYKFGCPDSSKNNESFLQNRFTRIQSRLSQSGIVKKLAFLISLFICMNTFSQNYVGIWKGDFHEADSIIHFEMNVMIQQDTTIGATLLRPTTCLLTDSSFYRNTFHFKSPKRAKTFKGEKRNITFTGELTSNINQLKGNFSIDGKLNPIEMFRSDKPSYRP